MLLLLWLIDPPVSQLNSGQFCSNRASPMVIFCAEIEMVIVIG